MDSGSPRPASSAADGTLRASFSPATMMTASTISGIVSGISTKMFCAPFDRIRLLYQVQGMWAASPSGSGPGKTAQSAVKYRSLYHTAGLIYQEEGLVGFWRGNMANMGRAAFVYALKFGTNDMMKATFTPSPVSSVVTRHDGPRSETLDADSTQTSSTACSSERLGVWHLMVAGFTAGLVQKLASFPLDLVSVRVALGVNSPVMAGKRHVSIPEIVVRIYKKEGVRGFYKGLVPTVLTGVPYVGLQMVFFELYKRQLRLWLGTSQLKTTSDTKRPPLKQLQVFFASSAAGSLASMTAQAIVFPGDTVRKRMMTNGLDGAASMYRSSLDCVMKMWRAEGALAFYGGLLPCVMRALPAGAIQFGTFELCKDLLLPLTLSR